MMKRLSKIALLAAASAFMLAVFPACGGDDEEEPKAPVVKATLALVGDAVTLEVGTEKTVTATVTVENDTFSATAKGIPAEGEIPTDYFELKAGTSVTVSKAKVKAWDSDTQATITFTVTAAEGAAAGTISANIKEGTLTNTDSLTTTGNIAYTIKGASDVPPGSNVNAVWDFSVTSLSAVGLQASGTTKAPKTDAIAPVSGSGATLKFNSTSLGKSVKIQNAETGGLNIGSGTSLSDMLLITVNDACTLSFTGNGSSGEDWTSSKLNSLSVGDDVIYTRTEAAEQKSQTWTYECTKAGDYKIKASGVILNKLECK